MARPSRSHRFDFLTEASYGSIFAMWVIVIVAFAFMYFGLSFLAGNHSLTGLTTLEPWVRLLNSLYFSVITSTTVGYGDLTPHGISRLLAAMQSVVGFIIFAVFIAKLVSHKEEIVLHEIHLLSYDSTFARMREGFFIVRKDFDLIMASVRSSKTLSSDDHERLMVALEEAQVLLHGIPDFYKDDLHLYTVDARRELLLLEAVSRTLRRMERLLQTMDEAVPSWRDESGVVVELRGFAVVLDMIITLWEEKSPHRNAEGFRALHTIKQELEGWLKT